MWFYNFLISLFFIPIFCQASLLVGIGKSEITPPIGTPSAGYQARSGKGMEGMHDPLLAIALFIDNGDKQIVLCSVDHLGFSYDMVQEVTHQVHQIPSLKNCEIFLGASHTHSGGGAYLNIPPISEALAGSFNSNVRKLYVNKTAEAIIRASEHLTPAKIGIGYGQAEGLRFYRASWPENIVPLTDVTVIKITHLNDSPLAILFNTAIHPTVLTSQNLFFSADFVGYAREFIQANTKAQALFFNGAQGDINPVIFDDDKRFHASEILGQSLAKEVTKIADQIQISEHLDIQTKKFSYFIEPKETPFGLKLPIEKYETEINLIIFNQKHPFITIPGELSTVYHRQLKEIAMQLGYANLSVLGLTNDAHGYILLPEAWRHKTQESRKSYAGENYGEFVKERVENLLKDSRKN